MLVLQGINRVLTRRERLPPCLFVVASPFWEFLCLSQKGLVLGQDTCPDDFIPATLMSSV